MKELVITYVQAEIAFLRTFFKEDKALISPYTNYFSPTRIPYAYFL